MFFVSWAFLEATGSRVGGFRTSGFGAQAFGGRSFTFEMLDPWIHFTIFVYVSCYPKP